MGAEVTGTPAAALVYDTGGQLLDITPGAARLLGGPVSSLLGARAGTEGWTLRVAPGGRIEAKHPVLAAIESRAHARAFLQTGGPSGRWLQCDAQPIALASGHPLVLATLSEIPELPPADLRGWQDLEAGLGELGSDLASSRLDAHALLSQVTSAISRARGATVIALLMDRDPTTSRVVVADSADPGTVDFIRRFVDGMGQPGRPPTTGISERVIHTGQPVFLRQIQAAEFVANMTDAGQATYSRLPWRERLGDGTFGLLIVPMRARGAVVGTLGLFDLAGKGFLADEDVGWLQAIADRTGLAVENAQLSELAFERQERLNAVRAVAAAVGDSQDLPHILEQILKQAAARLHVDAADALLVEADGSLAVVAATGFSVTTMPAYRIPMDDALRRHVEQRRHEPITDLGAIGHAQRQSLFSREGFRSYLGLPIFASRRLAGVLELFQRAETAWDQDGLDLLQTLADLAAIASVSARLTQVQPTVSSARGDLTASERQVLAGMADGLTNHEIADRLHLAESTVKFHVGQILRKVGAANRAQAVRRAVQEGWFQ